MPTRRAVEAAVAPATTIAITTGDYRALERATAMMATSGRSDEASETTAKRQTRRDESAITILAGPAEIATIENAIARSRMHSADMFRAGGEGGCVSDGERSRDQKISVSLSCFFRTNAPRPSGNARPGSLVSVTAFAYAGGYVCDGLCSWHGGPVQALPGARESTSSEPGQEDDRSQGHCFGQRHASQDGTASNRAPTINVALAPDG
jgi:hypothetical protein